MAANINQHASRAIYSRFAGTVSIVFGSHITTITFATRSSKCHGSSVTGPAALLTLMGEKRGHAASCTELQSQSGVLAATQRECRMGAKSEQW